MTTPTIRGFEIVARALAESGTSARAEQLQLRRASAPVVQATRCFRLSREALLDWVLTHAMTHGLIRGGELTIDATLAPLFLEGIESVSLDVLPILLDALLD